MISSSISSSGGSISGCSDINSSDIRSRISSSSSSSSSSIVVIVSAAGAVAHSGSSSI